MAEPAVTTCRVIGCDGTYRWCPDCGLAVCDAHFTRPGRCLNCNADVTVAPVATRRGECYPRIRPFLIRAFECTACFYTGWWLYADQLIHGQPEPTLGSHWFKEHPKVLATLAQEAAGMELPGARDKVRGGSQRSVYAHAFATAFPAGLRVLARNALLWDATLPQGEQDA